MNNYLFKIKKRRKYINLEKKNFFFNNVYNKKISKQSIIYKNWINKITSYYIKNGDKKNISKKIKIELIKIYNEIKNQKKIFWVIALNESHQRSDFIVNAFKKKFFSLIKKFYKENKHSSIKNQIKNSKIFQKNINLFNYDIIALNNISKKQKNYNFSKAVSFFISNKTFFWFINAFKSFKKKKNFIDFSWNFNKNIFFSKKYFFSYYIYFLNKKNWVYFYKNPNKKKKIYWNFWVNTNYKFNNKKKIHVYKKKFFFSNKFFFNFKKFKNKKIKKSKIFYKKKISFFYKKNVKFKWFKKSFFIKIFSKYIFFSTITKINKNKIYNYKKYFSSVYNKFQKYNIKKKFFFWWWFFWSIYKKNKSNALNKKKIEKQKIYNKKKKY